MFEPKGGLLDENLEIYWQQRSTMYIRYAPEQALRVYEKVSKSCGYLKSDKHKGRLSSTNRRMKFPRSAYGS